jgi:ATP-binding cassette subfamily B multidrug efflux pump
MSAMNNLPKKTEETKAMRPGGFGPGGGRGGFGPGAHMMGGAVQKPKNFKGTMRTLLGYLRPYRLSLIVVIFFAVASTALAIVGPKILGNATTRLFQGVVAKLTGSGAGIDFAYIGHIVLVLLGLYLLSSVCSYIMGWIMTGVAMKVTYTFRKRIAEKINRLPLRYFDTRTHGEVQSRVTNDVDTVGNTLNQSLTQIVTSVITIIGVLIMMLTISWIMTLVALLIVPLSGVLISLTVKGSQKYFKTQQDYLGHVNGHVEEMYSGHAVMKAFGGEARSVAQFNVMNRELYGAAWKSQFISGMMFPIMSFVGNLGFVAVSVLGGYLVVRGSIQVGDIQAFIQYMRSFNQPLVQTAQIANVLQSTAAAAERVFEFLAEPEKVAETAKPVALPEVKGQVAFEHVSFGYTHDKIVINDFSALVKPGQRVAIVGPTGAGKTTIVKLLMRFYDVNAGAITVDGVKIQDIRRADLRGLFGMVLQDTWLFNGTIKENIRYGNLKATDAEVVAAAQMAHADHFVRTLPKGYDTEINEEANNISSGEKQLLTIARAVLADPAILILDEATSSVDTRTEIHIQKAMSELMKGRTSFVIAHRLSTIRDADLILVMNNGSVIEQGNHVQLLAQGGFYADLYNSQFAGEDLQQEVG